MKTRKTLIVILSCILGVLLCGLGGMLLSPALKKGEKDVTIDVDLTRLSSTMVYSEVYNMVNTPKNYIGKTVKVAGSTIIEQSGNSYTASVLISDTAACCSQGLKFVLKGTPSCPDGYPKNGKVITIVGEFDTYVENGYTYGYIKNAALV